MVLNKCLKRKRKRKMYMIHLVMFHRKTRIVTYGGPSGIKTSNVSYESRPSGIKTSNVSYESQPSEMKAGMKAERIGNGGHRPEYGPRSERPPRCEQAPRYEQAPRFEPVKKYHVPDDTFRKRSCEGHGRHLGRSGRFLEDEGHRKHRWKLRRTTTHFNTQTTEWKLPTVIDGHMWRSLMVAAATHEYNPGEQHTSSRTTKVMVKVVTTEVTPTTRLVPRMVDSRKRREVELGVPCLRTEVARWSAEYSHWKTRTVRKLSLNYLEI